MKASSLESVLNNYKVLQALLEKAKGIAPDSETCTRITGVEFKMSTFPIFLESLVCVFLSTQIISVKHFRVQH